MVLAETPLPGSRNEAGYDDDVSAAGSCWQPSSKMPVIAEFVSDGWLTLTRACCLPGGCTPSVGIRLTNPG